MSASLETLPLHGAPAGSDEIVLEFTEQTPPAVLRSVSTFPQLASVQSPGNADDDGRSEAKLTLWPAPLALTAEPLPPPVQNLAEEEARAEPLEEQLAIEFESIHSDTESENIGRRVEPIEMRPLGSSLANVEAADGESASESSAALLPLAISSSAGTAEVSASCEICAPEQPTPLELIRTVHCYIIFELTESFFIIEASCVNPCLFDRIVRAFCLTLCFAV